MFRIDMLHHFLFNRLQATPAQTLATCANQDPGDPKLDGNGALPQKTALVLDTHSEHG